MEERYVAEYFVVCGLPEGPHQPLDAFSDDALLKPTYKQDPIVDLAIINKGAGETPPARFRCIETTPTGFPADLNHGSIRYPEMYLCYRRGRDKPPITDIGVLYDGKEKISPGCDAIYQTPYGRTANVNNNNNNHIYITFRRAAENSSCDTLSVMDICVILANKGETPPHAFMAVDKTLNKSMMGSTVHLCYKKSMAKTNFLAYKPDILGRYPLEDHPDFPLAHNVSMFCLPLGAMIEAWPAAAQHPMPKFSTFVLTQETGGKVYGAAVTFHEDYEEDKLTASEKEQLDLVMSPTRRAKYGPKTLHVNKSICLLSKWPFFNTFKTFLHYLYRISISGQHPVAMERYIAHFMNEVPFPTPQRPRIQVELNFNTISLFLPEESPLPQSGASYTTLLKHLGPENCLNMLLYTLMEHKILIHSLCPAVLTSTAEAIASMIFPFHWNCPYIPLCPLALSEYLSAPTPFIVGVDSRYFDLFDPPPDVTCVDLDTNTISVSEDKRHHLSNYKYMPKRLVKQLRTTLERLHELCCLDSYEGGVPLDNGFETFPVDQDLIRRRKWLEMESAIQEAFLRFMATMLKGYNRHLLPITAQPNQTTTDFTARFDVPGFIKSREKAHYKFYQQLTHTQNFTSFIQERSFVSDKDAGLAFFDECMEKVEDGREDIRLFEFEDTCNSERTVVITPPEPEPNGRIFNYVKFPDLDPTLFPKKSRQDQLSVTKHTTACPNSPMTKRTKQEVRVAQKTARKFAALPDMWAKCLLWHCYSLWFIHLPSYVKSHRSKGKALRHAYDVLCRLQKAKLQTPDEVCYRVLMQLCGQYHQPIMAVRVFSEMRRHGVNPNAITYGFYNKAVLESKWPSSDTAYLRWNKLRNAIMVIAQFRRNLYLRRRQSMCSISGSDCDRVSHGSVDSYLEEAPHANKTDGKKHMNIIDDLLVLDPGQVAMNAQHLDNHTIEGHNSSEEKSSTGGISDRGYSSMTLDDAKRISIVIGSQDSLDSTSKVKAIDPRSSNNQVKVHQQVKDRVHRHSGSASFLEPTNRIPDGNDAPPTKAVIGRKPLGIVRRSGGDGDECPDDIQNVLLAEESLLEDSVFGHIAGVSPCVNSAKSTDTNSQLLMRTSNDSGIAQTGNVDQISVSSEFTEQTISPVKQSNDGQLPSEPTPTAAEQSNSAAEQSILVAEQSILGAAQSMSILVAEQSISVAEQSNSPLSPARLSHLNETPRILEDILEIPITMETPVTMDACEFLTKNSKIVNNIETTFVSTPQENQNSGSCTEINSTSNKTLDPCAADNVITAQPDMDDSLLLENLLVSFETSSDENSPNKSLTSPIHSLRTPVTENDPLGLFIPPTLNTVASAPVLSGKLHEHLNHATSSTSLELSHPLAHSRDTLIDLQPFSYTSTPVHSRVALGNSHPESSSASSPSSPPGTWSPLSGTEPDQGNIGTHPAKETVRKANTLPATGSPSSAPRRLEQHMYRQYKTPSRSESFGSAFRSVTSKMANKLTEFKHAMNTPPKATGSSGSLHRPDVDRLMTEDSHMRKAGSLDYLGQGDVPVVPNHITPGGATISSMEDVRGAHSRSGRLAMPGLLNKASNLLLLGSYLPPKSSMKGWANKIGSMKESLKSTFKDSFSLGEEFSDSEDDDYYYKPVDSQSISSGNTRAGDDNSLHDDSLLDKGIHSILEPREEADGGSGDHVPVDSAVLRHGMGSLQSLPQTLFNIAMEVEICSLSRCKTCKSLLYDEEIMAGWTPDDSNLNTTCPFCAYQFVPSLQVFIKDYRHVHRPPLLSPSQSMESMLSLSTRGNHSQPNNVHRSMTSLSSGDNILSTSGGDKSLDSHTSDKPNEDCSVTRNLSGEGFMNDLSPNTANIQNPLESETIGNGSAPPSGGNLIQLSPPVTPIKHPEATIIVVDDSISIGNHVNVTGVEVSCAHSGVESSSSAQSEADSGVIGNHGDDSVATPDDSEISNRGVGNHGDDRGIDAADANSALNEDAATLPQSCVVSEPVTVPYLSPLVLRKELENVIEQEGDQCLNSSAFVDGHPIIYWNLLWYFQRLDVTSHIPGFILSAPSTNKQTTPKLWQAADSRHVSVRAVWDNVHMHDHNSFPLYLIWKKAVHPNSLLNAMVPDSPYFTKSLLAHILKHVREDDLLTPISLILQERQKLRALGVTRFRSMYRDLMFLTLVAFSKDSIIDLDLFDREYRSAFLTLSPKERNRLHVFDAPPTHKTSFCRQILHQLEL